MRRILLGLAVLALLAWGALEGWSYYAYRHHEFYPLRVLAVPPPNGDRPPLAIHSHLYLTPRPKETFSFPIALGETGPAVPLYAGGRQYPFFCMSYFSGLGQPLVDNQQGYGVSVYATKADGSLGDTLLGYSKDCLLPTRLHYYYTTPEGRMRPYHADKPPAANAIAYTWLNGTRVAEIYRVESGTINRYIYYITMLATPDLAREQAPYWNRKLIYQFSGGSGIGFRQGKAAPDKLLYRRHQQLRQGYAVISSTGNKTSYTYNMLLAEDTARRVKRQFVSLYGQPLYTVGIGGSGGGLAQYLMAQNESGIIDGALALYSYPDMVSQTLYGLDCDLLNTYYTFRVGSHQRWLDVTERPLLEGLSASASIDQPVPLLLPLNQLVQGHRPTWPKGSTECINGWLGLASLIHNPNQGYIRPMFDERVQQHNQWNYWHDLVQLYSPDAPDHAHSSWDNRGVQYGLEALQSERITVEEFLHINSHIGGWRQPEQMQPERLWAPLGKSLPVWLSIWGNHNVTEGDPAPRTRGEPMVAQRAYRSGQVFIGRNPLPVIDLRHYLDKQLDMHHLSASFEARARIDAWNGNHQNQLIWVSHKDYTPLDEAFAAMDHWLLARQAGQLRSADLQDQCFGADGQVLAAGEGVWDGAWNGRRPGACMQRYPAYSNSRIQAGGPWAGSIFFCQRIPVAEAIAAGFYGERQMAPYRVRLEQIFPDGVCDYRRGDLARPADLYPETRIAVSQAQ